jgi:hypothetical protein
MLLMSASRAFAFQHFLCSDFEYEICEVGMARWGAGKGITRNDAICDGQGQATNKQNLLEDDKRSSARHLTSVPDELQTKTGIIIEPI